MTFLRLYYLALVCFSCSTPFASGNASPSPKSYMAYLAYEHKVALSHLAPLTNQQLMQEYGDPGALVSLAPYEILCRNSPGQMPGKPSRYALCYCLFGDIKTEIRRRGSPMVPPLIKFLEALPMAGKLAPTPEHSGMGCWYDTETIALLSQIRDLRSAQELLHLLADDGKVKRWRQYAAESALESLTYCCFYKSGYNLSTVNEGLSMPHLEASLAFPESSRASDFKAVADFYCDWLAGEGRNPPQWLPLARHRAHLLLATDDPILIYDAATFLAHNDDDDPEMMQKRLTEIAAQVQEDGTEVIYDAVTRPKYLYKNQPIPSEIGDLRRFVSLRSR